MCQLQHSPCIEKNELVQGERTVSEWCWLEGGTSYIQGTISSVASSAECSMGRGAFEEERECTAYSVGASCEETDSSSCLEPTGALCCLALVWLRRLLLALLFVDPMVRDREGLSSSGGTFSRLAAGKLTWSGGAEFGGVSLPLTLEADDEGWLGDCRSESVDMAEDWRELGHLLGLSRVDREKLSFLLW